MAEAAMGWLLPRLRTALAAAKAVEVDPSVPYSVGIGLGIALVVVILITYYPGEPEEGWEIATEEQRFNALKSEILAAADDQAGEALPEGTEGTNEGGNADSGDVASDVDANGKKGGLRRRRGAAEGETKTDATSTRGEESSAAESAEKPKLTALEKELRDDARQEIKYLTEVRGFSKQGLKKMVKDAKYSPQKNFSCCRWIISFLNVAFPVGLIVALIYVLQTEMNFDFLQYAAGIFPREAAVIRSFAGSDQSEAFGTADTATPSRLASSRVG